MKFIEHFHRKSEGILQQALYIIRAPIDESSGKCGSMFAASDGSSSSGSAHSMFVVYWLVKGRAVSNDVPLDTTAYHSTLQLKVDISVFSLVLTPDS